MLESIGGGGGGGRLGRGGRHYRLVAPPPPLHDLPVPMFSISMSMFMQIQYLLSNTCCLYYTALSVRFIITLLKKDLFILFLLSHAIS
jgi:hypothetical protein